MTGTGRKTAAVRKAAGEELWAILRSEHPALLEEALGNPNLTEEMALYIAASRAATSQALGLLAAHGRFGRSYRIRLAVACHPRSPLRVALSLLKHIRLTDQADMTRDHYIPIAVRQRVEASIAERLKALPPGMKVALSRRASGPVIMKIMEQSDERVVRACLQSPRLTEEQLYRLANRRGTRPAVIRALAGDPKWSPRYLVRFALIRNFHTPMGKVVEFIEGMKTADLRTLHADPRLPTATRPFIHRELQARGQGVREQEEEIYELSWEDGGEAGSHGLGGESFRLAEGEGE
ncbi:MAG: hypothetical protein P8Y66_03085 [Nitrospirota bacterium]|jgi:hypothetical protein